MLFLRSWLEEYIDLSAYNNNDLADLISLQSGECESVQTITDYFGGKVVVGRVINIRKHPEADSLNVFEIDFGHNSDQYASQYGKVVIVSSADNAREGLICAVAIDGARLPYLTISPRKMRGIDSCGMCCGMSELALETQYSSGLWELNDIVSEDQLGISICEALPQYFPAQTIFEMKYLQDKLSSCANHLGLALELAKCLKQPNLLRGLASDMSSNKDFWSKDLLNIKPSSRQIELNDSTDFIATQNYNLFDVSLENEFNLPHLWQMRLFLTGKNLTGGLVDLSNYFLFDFGQPNHFFDGTKIESNQWTIQQLHQSQEFSGLGNFKKSVLPKGLSVIKDSTDHILLVPGITGSQSTKIELNSTSALVEITNFPAELVARNAFDVNYRSDSAKFFASGVDAKLQLVFLVKLLSLSGFEVQHCLLWQRNLDGQKSLGSILDLVNSIENKAPIVVDLPYIVSRLDNRGMNYWKPVIEDLLNNLGKVEVDEATITLTPEPFYSKIATNEDILFEISKLVGFDNLEPEYLTFQANSKTTNHQPTIDSLKNHFVQLGFHEVLTRPFLASDKLLSSLTNSPSIALEAISSQRADEPFLRDSLFSSLMTVATKNIKLGVKDIAIFEMTQIYTHSSSQPNQFSTRIDTGDTWENWSLSAISTTSDPYHLTSLVHSLTTKLKLKCNSQSPSITNLGSTTTFDLIDNNGITQAQLNLTQVANKLKKTFDYPINKPLWFIDIILDLDSLVFDNYKQFFDQSTFPVINRSVSYIINKSILWQDIENIIVDQSTQDNFRVRSNPVERFSHNDNSDVLNVDFQFVSYTQTLTSGMTQEWFDQLLQNLSKLGSISLR